MSRRDSRRAGRKRIVQGVFACMALASVLAGLAIYVFADVLGLSPESAQLVAFVFLAAGVMDYLILRFWDRISPRE